MKNVKLKKPFSMQIKLLLYFSQLYFKFKICFLYFFILVFKLKNLNILLLKSKQTCCWSSLVAFLTENLEVRRLSRCNTYSSCGLFALNLGITLTKFFSSGNSGTKWGKEMIAYSLSGNNLFFHLVHCVINIILFF